jgi:hypothetical protein
MKVRFTHFEYPPVFWRPMKHALRVTLGLTDTEHYVLTRLGNGGDPLFFYQIEDVEYAVTIADCVAGVRLDFDTLLQANEAQSQILRALENLGLILHQDCRSARVETFKIPQDDQYGPGRNHDTPSKPRAKPRGNRRRVARHPPFVVSNDI